MRVTGQQDPAHLLHWRASFRPHTCPLPKAREHKKIPEKQMELLVQGTNKSVEHARCVPRVEQGEVPGVSIVQPRGDLAGRDRDSRGGP